MPSCEGMVEQSAIRDNVLQMGCLFMWQMPNAPMCSVPGQAAEVFKTVLSDMVAHRYTPFSRDSCSIVYEVRLLPKS